MEKERLKVGDKWQGENHEFLFYSWNGKPMHPTSITVWWGRCKKKNGLPDIRFDDLRRTSATLLINSGVHAKIISARLGHADIRTTMNIYGHAIQEADTDAAKKFEDLFGTNKNNGI
jgi:integrase